jgi:hypothetical protein
MRSRHVPIRHVALALATLVTSALAAIAPSTPALAATGTISGTVTRGTGGAFLGAGISATTFDGGTHFTADTDAAGHYTVTVDPGTYCVSAGASINDVAYGTYGGATSCLDGAAPVVVSSGGTVANVNIVLHGGTIVGTVRNVDGSPLANADLQAQQVGGGGSGSEQSAANGSFTIADLPPGSYCLHARADNRLPSAAAGAPQCRANGIRVEVAADATTAPLDIRLPVDPASGSISGRVTYNGAPVASRIVFAYGIDIDGGAVAATAADGRYTLTGLGAGSYCVRVELATLSPIAGEAYQNKENCESATPVVVTSGTVANIDVALDLGGTLVGTVRGVGNAPLPNVRVDADSIGTSSAVWSVSAITDASGNYALTGLPAGPYCVHFSSATYAAEANGDALSCATSTPVTVTRGATGTVNAVLSLGGSITGHITVPAGADPRTLTVFAAGELEQTRFVHPDIAGNYTISGLNRRGRCVFVEVPEASDLIATSIGGGGEPCLSNGTIVVTDGATVQADATVALGGSISGFVTTQRHRPALEAFVHADTIGASGLPRVGRLERLRSDGSYRLRAVPAGTWCLHLNSGDDGIGPVLDSDPTTCINGKRITIAAGQAIGHVDFTPPDAAQVYGTILLPEKMPMRGYRLQFIPIAGGAPLTDDQPFQEAVLFREIGWNATLTPGTYCVIATVLGTDLAPRASGDVPGCDRGATLITVAALQFADNIDIHLRHVGFSALAAPVRLMDTRTGEPTVDGQASGQGAIAGGTVRELQVAGRGGIAADATSAVLNVTAVAGATPGFLTVFPCGTTRPTASNLNYMAGQVTPNAVITKVGTGGKVCFFAQTTVDVIVDVSGSIPRTDTFTALPQPARLMDTRAGEPTVDGQASGEGAIAGGTVRELQVTGRAGVPATSSVVLNVTAANGAGAGFLTVFPCGATRPTASNLNFVAGQVTPNAVISKVGTGGKVCFFAQTTVDVIVDVSGHVPSADTFVPLPQPARLMDTRAGEPTVDGQASGAGAVAGGTVRELVVAGRGGVPANAASAVLNVTAVAGTTPGFLTVFPCGTTRPTASNLNFVAGQVTPNAVITKIGTGGKVCFFAQTTVDVIVDTSGSFPS